MFKFARNDTVDSQPCLRCASERTVVGTLSSADGSVNFLPRGLRWWAFWKNVPLVPESVQACLDCGCLMGGVDPRVLRTTIERAGDEDVRRALGRTGGPQSPDRAPAT
jgi:hypothetical protein